MANLATLVAKVEANANDFGKVLDKTEKNIKGVEKAAQHANEASAVGWKTLGKWIIAATVAIGAYLSVQKAVNFTIEQAGKVINANKFARSINDTVGNVLEMRSAFRQVGGEIEDIDAALLNLARKVRFAQGDSTTANVFQRMGLSVDKLKQMKPSEQFIKVAEAISKIENPQKRAALAVQIFGDKAKELLPLINQGADGIAKLRDRAKEFGQTADEMNANSIEALAQKWDDILQTVEGIGMQLAVRLAPLIQAFLEDTIGVENSVVNIEAFFRSMLRTFARGIVLVQDLWSYFKLGVATAGEAFAKLQKLILQGMLEIAKISEDLDPFGTSTKAREGVEAELAKTDELIRALEDVKAKETFDIQNRDPDKFLKKADEIARKQNEAIKKRNKDGDVGIANVNVEAFSKALDIIRETRTPLENFNDKINELNQLLQDGAIDWDTFGRASRLALQNLGGQMGEHTVSFAGATKGGSAEAYSAIVRHQFTAERFREDPQKRIERLTQEANEIRRQQLEQEKKIADALVKQKEVNI